MTRGCSPKPQTTITKCWCGPPLLVWSPTAGVVPHCWYGPPLLIWSPNAGMVPAHCCQHLVPKMAKCPSCQQPHNMAGVVRCGVVKGGGPRSWQSHLLAATQTAWPDPACQERSPAPPLCQRLPSILPPSQHGPAPPPAPTPQPPPPSQHGPAPQPAPAPQSA